VDHDSHDQRASDPAMDAPAAIGRQSRQISGDQQGLNEHQPERDDPGEAGQDVERIAPCEQRARRRGGDRHAKGRCKDGPDQGRPGRSRFPRWQFDQAG
jgi:hypothetical protein